MKLLPTAEVVVSTLLAALLGFFALLVLPAYGLFMFSWLHAPAEDLLSTLLPVGFACLGIALLFMKLAHRVARRARAHASGA